MQGKIKVIFTGCTIGSAAKDGRVDLDEGANRRLLEMFYAERGAGQEFDCEEPVSMLSENVHEEQLHAIYAAVKATDPAMYGGIIITHGTDSLCINAHYFALTLCNAGLPIVLVSSLYPLEDARQNGLKNFTAAVDFIRTTRAKGVFVAFANGDAPADIHLASRLMFCDQLTGWYRSVLDESLATVENGRVTFRQGATLPDEDSLSAGGAEAVSPDICRDVMLITARSLLNFSPRAARCGAGALPQRHGVHFRPQSEFYEICRILPRAGRGSGDSFGGQPRQRICERRGSAAERYMRL